MPDISNPTVHAHHSNPQKLLHQARLVIFADNHNQNIKIFKCVKAEGQILTPVLKLFYLVIQKYFRIL